MKHGRSIVLLLLSWWCLFRLLRSYPTASTVGDDFIVRDDGGCRSRDYVRHQQQFTNNSTSSSVTPGIVLFYHIAKTGGTTIRRNFAPLDHVHYVLAKGIPEKQIEAVLNGKQQNKKTILFVEFHKDSSGVPQLAGYIQDWRRRSQQRNIRFFAFTLLRDPIALHVSAYTFLHPEAMGNSDRSSGPALEEQLLEGARPNRQCRVLYHGQGPVALTTAVVSARECEQVRHHLCHDWDWVGTTEQLNTSTFPILYQFIHYTTRPEHVVVKSANVQPKTFSISNHTRQRLEQLSRLDQTLYNVFSEHTDG